MEFNNPKVSVIIPTYNRPHLIGRAIKSVLDQTYQNFEIVVIDDSSNEETEKIINNLNDKRIKYIKNKEREGVAVARNQGVRNSSKDSKYIAFLDDDDQYLPLFLEKTIKTLEEDKELAAVTTLGETRLPNEEVIDRGESSSLEFWRCPIGTGWVIRKEIFFKENLWYDKKAKFREDWDFGIRFAKNHRVKEIPEILKIRYGYPSVQGESRSTFTPLEDIEDFYLKHIETYKEAGRKAESWLHYSLGVAYCKAGSPDKGKSHFLKGLLTYPNLKYFLYYFLALVYPKIFQNMQIVILKHKIFRKVLKLK
jgi:glycosyltransferase involved in cell wall biosynthesis